MLQRWFPQGQPQHLWKSEWICFIYKVQFLWTVVREILSTCPINSAWIWHLRKEIIFGNVCRTVTCVKEILGYRHFVILQEEDFSSFLFWMVFCFLFWILQSHFQRRFLWPFLPKIYPDAGWLGLLVFWTWFKISGWRHKGINTLKSFSTYPSWCFSCLFFCCVFCDFFFFF